MQRSSLDAYDPLEDFLPRKITLNETTKMVHVSGHGPAVIVIPEVPGISPHVARFARWVREAGFTVYMPSLYGRDGEAIDLEIGQAIFKRVCVSAEFRAFGAGGSSPVTKWLRALANLAHSECGGPGVGAIGMCFSGNFALSMMLEPSMLAPVLSQPALPLDDDAGLEIAPDELRAVKARLDKEDLTVMAYRFEGDRFCKAQRFAAYQEALGDRFIGRVLPDSAANKDIPEFFEKVVQTPHNVVTVHLIDEEGQLTRRARDEILEFFVRRLAIRRGDMPRSLAFLFAAACTLSVANVYYAQPLLDALATDFNISHAAVGGVITATQVGCACALLLLVPLGDLVDRRRLMAVQLLALVATLVMVGCAQSTSMLLAGMLGVGLLGTAMTQGLTAYAASAAAPHEQGRVVGAAQGGVFIGLLMARVFAGSISDLAGWRGVYVCAAVLMLMLAWPLWRRLPALVPAAGATSYRRLIASMFTLLREERVLQIRGMLALLMFATFSIFWSALVLPLRAPPYALSHTAIGAFGLVGVAGALAAARAGQWADRGFGQRTSATALMLLLLAWWPISLMAWSLWALVVGIVLLDLGGQALHVTNQSMIFRTRPEANGRLVGLYMLFYAVGSGLGAISTTAVYAHAGWQGVCLLGAAVSLSAMVFWAATRRHMVVAAWTAAKAPAAMMGIK